MSVDRDNVDPVLRQLKKLREGRGLTEGRLKAAGAVMSALGTSDPTDGLARLSSALDGLGDGERQRALQVDFGLRLTERLARQPNAREVDWLGDRRAGYGTVIGRDVKTLGRWSDAVIADLRNVLISDTFTGNLYVVAVVDGDRIVGITVTEEDLGQDGPIKERRSTEIPNTSQEASIPALLYAIPRDWRPVSLHMAVVFIREQRPRTVEAIVSETLLTLPFAAERYVLQVTSEGSASCRFQRPSRHRVYAIRW